MWKELVDSHPLISAMVIFSIIGIISEVLGQYAKGSRKFPFTPIRFIGKILIWAVLGLCIRYAFTGFHGFVDSLISSKFLTGEFTPFFIAIFTVVLFGPYVIIIHRFLNNLLARKWEWKGLKGKFIALTWFWIPALTITFMLPVEMQIAVSSLWLIVFYLIFGVYERIKG